nr:hypothetical protein [Sinorhizobium meliloti]
MIFLDAITLGRAVDIAEYCIEQLDQVHGREIFREVREMDEVGEQNGTFAVALGRDAFTVQEVLRDIRTNELAKHLLRLRALF